MQKLTAKLMEAMYVLKHRDEHKSSKGFTLIELVVVIAIIAVLLALIAPNLIGYLGQAKSTKSMATAKSVYTATCAKNAAKPISKSTGLVKIAMTTGDLADYFNQEEIKDIKDGKVTAFMNNGTIEGVKVEYEDGSPSVYYPAGCEALFEGGEAEELEPDESPYGENEEASVAGFYNGDELIMSWEDAVTGGTVVMEGTKMTSLRYGATVNPTTLTKIVMPNDITDFNTFTNGLSLLTSITLPSSLTNIPSNAFASIHLESINIPNGVASIGEGAFNGCTDLTSISLPNSVASIGYKCFKDCSSLASVTLSSNITSLPSDGWIFSECIFTSITLPEGIETIPYYTAMDCPNLETVILPSSVKTIKHLAFYNCPNAVITVPNTVETVEDNAFYGIKEVHYSGGLDTSSWGATVISD